MKLKNVAVVVAALVLAVGMTACGGSSSLPLLLPQSLRLLPLLRSLLPLRQLPAKPHPLKLHLLRQLLLRQHLLRQLPARLLPLWLLLPLPPKF